MSRRPKDPGDEFSHADLAIASLTAKRSIQLIADHGLLPGDRGIRDLKRACVIGAFVLAGAPMLVAGKLAEKILWSFNQTDGEMPSGLSMMARKLDRSSMYLPEDAEPNDYWYHRDLFRKPDIYKAGEVYRSDAYIEIADREYVYLTYRNGLPMVGAIGSSLPNTTYEGKIEGWARGSEPLFHSLAELPPTEWDSANAEALTARTNAVGLLTINASLAIRNGLDRLAKHRRGQ